MYVWHSIYVFVNGYSHAHVQIIKVQWVHGGVYVDSICFHMCVYVTWLWVLGRLEVLVGLIEKDHCQGNSSMVRLSWNTNTQKQRLSHTHYRNVWFCFYFHLLCHIIFLSLSFFFHHLLCFLYSLILSCGVWLPVPVPSLWLTGLDDVTAIMRMCP